MPNHVSILRYLLSIGIFTGVFAAGLFLSAGTLRWPMGWGYLGLVAISQVVTALLLLVKNPQLARERTQVTGDRDLDRVLAGVMALYGPLAICIVSGLDLRYSWPPPIGLDVQMAGLALAVAGASLTLWAMAENRFFYSVMRIEKALGHVVCTSGPYRWMRHPGYAGAVLFTLASPFILGSPWALVPAALVVLAIVGRTALEDEKLRAELDGYQDYAHTVVYRLIPGIW